MSSSDPVNSEDVVFREARGGGLPAILALLGDDPLGKYRELALAGHARIPAACKAAFEAIAADPRNQLYVAEIGGAVAGYFQLTFIPGLTYQGGGRAQIEGVRVSQAMRGRGVGRAMMRYAIARARAHGCVLMQLTTGKRRAQAHEFYRALGFADSHVGMKLLM